MSYRNPRQVVDTQTGQHYANLQKTIAGSFDNYAKSVQVSDAKKQKEKEIKANRESKRINDIIKNKNKGLGDAVRTDNRFTTIGYGGAKSLVNDSADIQIGNKTLTPGQNKYIRNVNEVGSLTRASAEVLISDGKTFNDALERPRGTMGGIARGEETQDYEELYGSYANDSETNAVYTVNASNDISISYETKSERGTKKWNKSNKMPQLIINWQKDIDNFNEQGLTNEAFNYENPDNEIYKGGEVIYDKNGEPEAIMPNKEKYEESIYKGVRANIIGAERANDAIAIYNDVFRKPNKEGEMPTEIPMTSEWMDYDKDNKSPEAIQQRKYQDRIAEAATSFVSNQADILKKPYRYRGTDNKPEASVASEGFTEGQDLYDKMKQNPVGLYQEYNKAAPGYDREAGTITIYAKDVEGDDARNIVYDMENDSERNEFYLYLLESSGRNKGSSVANKAFQKDFEEAMRSDTSNRSKQRKKESAQSKKENSGKGPLSNDSYGKLKALDFINKYSKKK
jgi:hypothetical protein